MNGYITCNSMLWHPDIIVGSASGLGLGLGPGLGLGSAMAQHYQKADNLVCFYSIIHSWYIDTYGRWGTCQCRLWCRPQAQLQHWHQLWLGIAKMLMPKVLHWYNETLFILHWIIGIGHGRGLPECRCRRLYSDSQTLFILHWIIYFWYIGT